VRNSSQVGAWFFVLAIVALSVVPPDYRVIVGFPRPIEHLSIFLLAGLAFGLGYPYRYATQSICLILFAGMVELMQLGIPGRHARLSDFVASTLGVGVAYIVLRLVTQAAYQSVLYKSLFRGIGTPSVEPVKHEQENEDD
jgi:VanZ family protein